MKGQEAFHPISEGDAASRPWRGQQLLDVLRPPQERRHDFRGEADARAAGAITAVADLRPADGDWSDPGLDLTLGRVTVADDTAPAMRVLEFGVRTNKRLELGLDHLLQHAPRPVPQHQQQRIIGDTRPWPRQTNNGCLSMAYPSW